MTSPGAQGKLRVTFAKTRGFCRNFARIYGHPSCDAESVCSDFDRVIMTNRPVNSASRTRQGFLQREDGTFAVFSLFVFVTMLLVAGLAIDLMRHETVRTRMQGVSDRAVLAATMMGNNNGIATPEQLLQSYFSAADLSAYLGSQYTITESPVTGRNVYAAPTATVPTLLSRLVGVDDLPVATPSAAAESVQSAWLDLVMVLDISGSMGFDGGNRIIALRQAASTLANALLSENDDRKVSITLVPYDTSVLIPQSMFSHFTNVHGSGACGDFNNWNHVTNGISLRMQRHACHESTWGMVSPFIGDAGTAVAAINALQPRDVTSIDLGLRWGAMFLDPSIRPAIDELITLGLVENDFDGRPFDYSEPNVVRAVVLLTDGENCCGHRYTQSRQDDNTIRVCDALKDEGVLIYTISFEATPAGQTLMMNCASSPSHYFDSAISGLNAVFAAIASNVVTQTLRLTQ